MPRRSPLVLPLRMEIVEELLSRGPSSIAELARALVRPQSSLYYHVHKLVKAGVVREKEHRKAKRQVEVVYALVPRQARLEAKRAVERAESVARLASSVLRKAERTCEQAAMKRLPIHVATKRVRLTPAEAERFASQVQGLAKKSAGKGGKAFLWAFALAPIVPGRRGSGAG